MTRIKVNLTLTIVICVIFCYVQSQPSAEMATILNLTIEANPLKGFFFSNLDLPILQTPNTNFINLSPTEWGSLTFTTNCSSFVVTFKKFEMYSRYNFKLVLIGTQVKRTTSCTINLDDDYKKFIQKLTFLNGDVGAGYGTLSSATSNDAIYFFYE